MKRRTALKQLGVLAGAAALLPQCIGKETVTTPASIALNKISITGNQETLLATIAETLIPKTDSPGAGELKVHHVALRMIDDCTEAPQQQSFLLGLKQFERAVEEKAGKSFEEISAEERKKFLMDAEAGKLEPTLTGDEKNSIQDFYSLYRGQVIWGYLESEYVMTNVFGYNMIPGKFTGVVEINANSDLKTILG